MQPNGAGWQLVLQVLAMPADTNPGGDIFGGWLMSQADIAGGVVAYQRARGRVATVAVNEFVFLQPVFVGDLVRIYARIVKIGRTSITVQVQAFAERDRNPDNEQQVAEARLSYVAIDERRRPVEVPPED